MRRGRDFDEDDVRVRANPRGSRPRTKIRPTSEDAANAMVLAVDRGRYTCLISSGERAGAEVTAMKARELGRKGVVVGDDVSLVGDLRGGPDALARVVRVQPRRHVLRRTADDTDPVERVIVANADQLVIVTALADPGRARMIDRCLVAALEAQMPAVLCLTKADLADPTPLVEAYRPLGVEVVVTRQDGDLTALRRALAGKTSVLVGHSGVGKSTLVNALIPGAARVVGVVNDVTGRGRHTSTSAVALRLPASEAPAIDVPSSEAPARSSSAGVSSAGVSAAGSGAADSGAAGSGAAGLGGADSGAAASGATDSGASGSTHPNGGPGPLAHPDAAVDAPPSRSSASAPHPDGPAPHPDGGPHPDGSVQPTDTVHPDGLAAASTDDAAPPDAVAGPASAPSAAGSPVSPVAGGSTVKLPAGWVIDTPGVRSFGLAHVAPEAVVAAFPDLAAITAQCPRGCTHMADSPDCLLDEFPVDPARLDSLRRLLSALTSGD